MKTVTILGAGISGLTTSFHVGHENCVIYESKSHYGGHIWSESRDGFTWDDGPHVSFTNNEYVRKVLAESVDQQFEEKRHVQATTIGDIGSTIRRSRTCIRSRNLCVPPA